MILSQAMLCFVFALSEWRAVAFYKDDKGHGVVKDYATNEEYSERIGFVKADGEMVCIIK